MADVVAHWNHWVVVVLMMTGFYVLMARNNLVKKLLGLNVLQASVILMYVTMAKVDGGTAAILLEAPEHHAPGDAGHADDGHGQAADGHGEDADHGETADHGQAGVDHAVPDAAAQHTVSAGARPFSNVLPHVLMLTAIVVGIATTALGLALVVRIQEAYGTIEEDEILAIEEAEA